MNTVRKPCPFSRYAKNQISIKWDIHPIPNCLDSCSVTGGGVGGLTVSGIVTFGVTSVKSAFGGVTSCTSFVRDSCSRC
jgi:hypothetical protein